MSADLEPDTRPDGDSGTPEGYRRALRQQCIERRLALTVEECARLSASVCEHLRRDFPELARMRVGFCWPVNNEPDLRPLLSAWRAAAEPGFTALLPVVVDVDRPLACGAAHDRQIDLFSIDIQFSSFAHGWILVDNFQK